MNLASRKLNTYYMIILASTCGRVGINCGGYKALSDTLASINAL